MQTHPGKEYAYSNLGVALLGVILEKVSGKTYEQMIKEIICNPLQMHQTVQHLSEAQKKSFVHVYNDKGVETPAWDFQAMAAAGALRSSVHDLLLYAQANIKKEHHLVKAMELTQRVSFNDGVTVGMGWHVKTHRPVLFICTQAELLEAAVFWLLFPTGESLLLYYLMLLKTQRKQ